MEKGQTNNQQSLYAALWYYGLLQDLKIVEDEMRNNEPLSTEQSNGVLKNFWNKNVTNEVRRRTMTKLSEKKNNIINRLEELKSKYGQSGVDYGYGENRDELLKRIAKDFKSGDADVAKALFALRFSLDGEIKYENAEYVNAEISQLLFGDRSTLDNLYGDLKENYVQLFKAPYIRAQSTILKCLGISALIAVALPPLFAGGVFATALIAPALIDGVLLDIGIGVTAVTAVAATYTSIVLGGALLGTEIAKQLKVKEVKECLRKASPEDWSLLLAIKATLIQYAKKRLGTEEMKSALDDCLKQLNDLRSDAEYLLIVEKLDAEKSKKKIEICNNFTTRLATIVGF